ncbi:PREDICTED: uncharacterized protein LOC109208771 isoform X1 [Nicotiana attenuata]|uniref:Uncharacterized protein n=1 Tax=Nicotiana attenuata TaxID=49451 RepID=A0A314KPW1_NICAT|nr:PREDICTED: uncharacterized protein LOC109208771 isoform X1 [Nicotiana attenuata]OIT31368.1 hypothetical protein A4A49_18410 [Nicotiana attenuata]
MEDSLTDIPNLNFSSFGDEEVEEQIQENVGEISEESKDIKGKEEGGVIHNFISNIMSPRSGDEEVEEQIQENVGEISEERKDSTEGGVINNFISNLMSPRAGDASNNGKNNFLDEDNNKEDIASEQSGNSVSGSGGIINNFISNIFHPTENINAVEINEENSSGEGQKGGVVQENETASVLDNIVSHLPTPLADDAVPATDEASMLIHSIVHD